MITIIFNVFLFCFAFWLTSPKLPKGLHQTQTLATNHKSVPGQSLYISPFWSTKRLRGELRHFSSLHGLFWIGLYQPRQPTAEHSPAKLVQNSLPRFEGTPLWSFARSLRPLRGVALPLLRSEHTRGGSALRWVNKTWACRGGGGDCAWPSLLI